MGLDETFPADGNLISSRYSVDLIEEAATKVNDASATVASGVGNLNQFLNI